MKSKMKIGVRHCLCLLGCVLVSAVVLRHRRPSRFLGTVTAVNGNTLTVKTDAGEVHQVEVPSTASLKQIEPGAKDLSTAQTIDIRQLWPPETASWYGSIRMRRPALPRRCRLSP